MDTIEEQKAQLKQYASIKAQIATLEDQLDMIRPSVEVAIAEINPTDKIVETDFGTFTLVLKRKYTYTPETQDDEKILKEKKKNEEATGAATYVENPYVLFKSVTIN